MIESGKINEILDTNLQGKINESQLKKMVWAASLCITRAARLRPKMNQVIFSTLGSRYTSKNKRREKPTC